MKALNVSMMAIGFAVLVSCSPAKKEEEQTDETQMPATEETMTSDEPGASATLSGASGSTVSGHATFTKVDDQTVRMTLEVENLKPGDHALHLHQNGDCSAPDATSAGGHWNPTEMPHGKRGEGEFHKGDIINLIADANGKVSWSEEIKGWTIGGADSTNILNRAIIIHEKQDDFVSQPSGAAGARVACGVIESNPM